MKQCGGWRVTPIGGVPSQAIVPLGNRGQGDGRPNREHGMGDVSRRAGLRAVWLSRHLAGVDWETGHHLIRVLEAGGEIGRLAHETQLQTEQGVLFGRA